MKKITLYIKTHNKTGLKYFGKHQGDDVFSYNGSGTYWKSHLAKHGYDITTEILGVYEDEELARKIAVDFSLDNNIVESDLWANLKIENLDGGWDFVNNSNLNGYYSLTEEEKKKLAVSGGNACYNKNKGIHAIPIEKRKLSLYKDGIHIQQTEETRNKTIKTNRERYGVDFPVQTTEVKTKIKKSLEETYGVDNPMKSDAVKKKHKDTIMKIYGVENVSKSDAVKEKKRKIFLEKYGTISALNTQELKEKNRAIQKQKRNRNIVKRLEHLRNEHNIRLPKNYPLMKDEKLFLLYQELLETL